MARQKFYIKTGAQVDNVVKFNGKESQHTIRAKEIAGLKQCGVTKNCLESKKENPYSCECFEKCNSIKEVLRLFI